MRRQELLFLVATLLISAFAEAQIVLGTGGSDGTYFAMANDMIKRCGATVTISVNKAKVSSNVIGHPPFAFTAPGRLLFKKVPLPEPFHSKE